MNGGGGVLPLIYITAKGAGVAVEISTPRLEGVLAHSDLFKVI